MVTVLNRQRGTRVEPAGLARRAQACLCELGIPNAELCIVLVSDRSIQRLNRKYLGRSGPTDVIAFPMREGCGSDLNPEVLGDVVVSVETAGRHARARRVPLEEEIDLLVAHGLLHLLGYDHSGAGKDASRMFRKQRSLAGVMRREAARHAKRYPAKGRVGPSAPAR